MVELPEYGVVSKAPRSGGLMGREEQAQGEPVATRAAGARECCCREMREEQVVVERAGRRRVPHGGVQEVSCSAAGGCSHLGEPMELCAEDAIPHRPGAMLKHIYMLRLSRLVIHLVN